MLVTRNALFTLKPIGLVFGFLLLLITTADAREIGREGAWRIFQNSSDCWSSTSVRASSNKTTGEKNYVSVSQVAKNSEPEVSLTIERQFPKGQAIGLLADGQNIPLVIYAAQTAYPKDNSAALFLMRTADRVLFVADGKGYVIEMDGFQKALERIHAACQ